MVNGEWDVFSGVKLSYDVADDGTVTINKTDAALMTNGYELVNGEMVEMANPEIVAAGGASVEDSVITGSMNYFVAGVQQG